MAIQESGEMYLETILVLSERSALVRSIDVVEYMNFSKPSVSRAITLLRDGGYVLMDKKTGALTLTEQGRAVAQKIYERHRVLTGFLSALGVSEEIAAADACKIEHDISDESFEAIKKFSEKEKMQG